MVVRSGLVYDYSDAAAAMGEAMNGFLKSRLMVAGATLMLLGMLAIAVPVVTTQESTDIIKLDGSKLVVKEETPHVIPPYVGWAAFGFGAMLVVAGLFKQRAD